MNISNEELKALVASIAVAQLEVAKQQKETDRQLQEIALETAQHQKETDRLFQEVSQEMAQYRKETERQFQETDRRLLSSKLEVDRQLKELRVQIGGIGNKFGSFTEGMALASMEKILRNEFGLERFYPNAKSTRGDRSLELDMLGYNNGTHNKVVVVEIKSHLKPRDIEQVLKILEMFPEFFPEHADKDLYGVVAAVAANKEAQQQVIEAGLYLGKIHDEQFRLTVPPHFVPKCFSKHAHNRNLS